MTENNFNLSEFYHEIYIDASFTQVFKLVATSHGICSWFIGECIYTSNDSANRMNDETARKGDGFRWKWLNKELKITGEVLESVDNELFRFTFGKDFVVSIKLKEEGKRTLISLFHSYKPGTAHNDFAFINCCVCWVFFLTNLKSVAENNIDLREINSTKETLVNY